MSEYHLCTDCDTVVRVGEHVCPNRRTPMQPTNPAAGEAKPLSDEELARLRPYLEETVPRLLATLAAERVRAEVDANGLNALLDAYKNELRETQAELAAERAAGERLRERLEKAEAYADALYAACDLWRYDDGRGTKDALDATEDARARWLACRDGDGKDGEG